MLSTGPESRKITLMEVLATVRDVRVWVAEKRKLGHTIGLVPTMGAFHEGHLALMRQAASECESVLVSIFVNPTQFGPGEDFERYPRDLESDLRLAEGVGVTAVFAPSQEVMYPPGSETRVLPGRLAEGLCGPFRPGHFVGVATVVAKLFGICLPDHAYFGEKDFQQLRIIEQMTADLCLPVAIVRCPTVRETDGLAMSSRNAYLSAEERRQAPAIYRAIRRAAEVVRNGERSAREVERMAEQEIRSEPLFHTVEYVHIVDPVTLQRVETVEGEVRLCVAARIGTTRLIDNGVLAP
jgi:pantoate--beta-alanine ligase